ncbi:MAG: FimB/Mfa2 family fimbrial subunit [Alistipes sp.]|nr:FimB/Mfa2 family fimbrial subunit [Alistipes sp.]
MRQLFFRCLGATALLFAASCSNEPDLGKSDPYLSDDTAVVTISLGVEGRTQTRAEGQPAISDGTRATTLIYAIYNNKGDLVKITNPNYKSEEETPTEDRLVTRAKIDGIEFPHELPAFELVKGLEYTMVFWAQSENGDTYYDTNDLKNIQVKYENAANNDELRDAFCARYTLILSQSDNDKEVTITLKRPFAQINVGFTKAGYELMKSHSTNGDITKSSITVKNVSNLFDLYSNNVGTASANIVDAEYAVSATPSTMEIDGSTLGQYLQVDIDNNGQIADTEEFVWLSMCYILAPDQNNGTSTYRTTVDISNLKFYYEDGSEYETDLEEIPFVPVQRNHRTNILFDPANKTTLLLHLDPNYDEDDSNIRNDQDSEDNWSDNSGN